jgi:hypothetical protein
MHDVNVIIEQPKIKEYLKYSKENNKLIIENLSHELRGNYTVHLTLEDEKGS